MVRLTFCCNCDRPFETDKNIYGSKDDGTVYSVQCSHCSYYLIVTRNTKMFNEDYNKRMSWLEFLRDGE